MLYIDGSRGEGGGQILRTALGLSLVTGKPFRIDNIRGRRRKPGLMRQHLTAVNAAVAIGHAQVSGNHLHSTEITFEPRGISGGDHAFAVGSAGSCTLVLQTVLPALLVADRSAKIQLDGGTHNPFAPPFDFLQLAFLPVLRRMGATITADLEKPGFYPAGGGRFTVKVDPPEKLAPIEIMTRGEIIHRKVRAQLAQIPDQVGQRELKVIANRLNWNENYFTVERHSNSAGPGNILTVEIASDTITEVFTGFGEKRRSAERVAEDVVGMVRKHLQADIPIGPHLADQLLVPLALAGGGRFRTVAPTLHTRTNAEVVEMFLNTKIALEKTGDIAWTITVRDGARRE